MKEKLHKRLRIALLLTILHAGLVMHTYAQDRVTAHLDLDSMADLPHVDTSLKYMQVLYYKNDPMMLERARPFTKKVVIRAMRENYFKKDIILQGITSYCLRNEEYQLGHDLLDYIYHKRYMLNMKEQALLFKYRAIFYNKIGQFQKSIEVFERGLELALNWGDDDLIYGFYHHLVEEYAYLARIDTTYYPEFRRLNDKCYEYAIKTDDSTNIVLQQIRMLDKGATVQQIREATDRALHIMRQTSAHQYTLDMVNTFYVLTLYFNDHFREFLDAYARYRDLFEPNTDPELSTFLAKSYIETGNIAMAKKYALEAQVNYAASKDKDRLRAALVELPNIFGKLGMHEQAYRYSKERKEMFQNQIITYDNLSSEVSHFNQEITSEESQANHQKRVNTYLGSGLGFIGVSLIALIFVSRTIRRKNSLLESTMEELESVHDDLGQANNDLQSFAYASAHDIKNPIHTIGGFLELIRTDPDTSLTEDSIESIQNMESSIDSINKLIASILAYAKVGTQSFTPEPVDLNKTAKRVKLLLTQQIKDSNAQVEIKNELPVVLGSPDLLRQVMLNLVSNGIKYRRDDVDPVIEISSTQDEENYYINVKDNGIGIPEKNLKDIFNLFGRADNTSSYEGQGVGLAVSMKIAVLHGGSICVQNNPHNGSTFTLVIPIKKQKSIHS